MRAIVIGAGEVGYQIAKFLTLEGVEVVVVDTDKDKLKRLSEELDVAIVLGEGGSPSALEEADAGHADMLLAVTNSDETNMIACLLAKSSYRIPRKIARIRNYEYFSNKKLLEPDTLDINPAINPEHEAANAIIRLLEIPFASEVEEFEDGIIKIIGVRVPEGFALAKKSLHSIRKNLPPRKFLIGIIERDVKAIIPSGNDQLRPGDIIHLPVKRWEIGDVATILGLPSKPTRRLMILGGGRIGHYVAEVMEKNADVKVIEQDMERCKLLSRTLRKSIILHGDGTDQQLLQEENVADMDVFISATNNEELNIMASLLAKKLGVPKTITVVNRTDYIPLAYGLGLQAVLSPRLITASSILKYVRRGDILSLTAIAEGRAEVLEARIGGKSPLLNKRLSEAKLPSNSLIGVIVRNEQMIIPSGEDDIRLDDKLIIFTLKESIRELEKLLV